MNCCPTADITFLAHGIHVSEKNNQAEGFTLQFIPFRAIQTIRYTSEKRGQGGTLTIWIHANGTPGAGGLSYRYLYPCGESGKKVFEDIMNHLV